MTTKVFSTSDVAPLMLPRELFMALSLEEGAEVEASVQDGKIVIAPATNGASNGAVRQGEGVDERFAQLVNEVIEEYRPALEALA